MAAQSCRVEPDFNGSKGLQHRAIDLGYSNYGKGKHSLGRYPSDVQVQQEMGRTYQIISCSYWSLIKFCHAVAYKSPRTNEYLFWKPAGCLLWQRIVLMLLTHWINLIMASRSVLYKSIRVKCDYMYLSQEKDLIIVVRPWLDLLLTALCFEMTHDVNV